MSAIAERFSLKRTASLTRWNATLLTRNRLAFVYAVVLPLLPLLLLLVGDRGSLTLGPLAIVTMMVIIAMFPVYYNVLAQFVSRRDELVLKRMRTGESRDGELLASIALPGVVCALLLGAVAVPIAAALGQPVPVNALLYGLLLVAAVIMFVAFAYWTAAWTKNAEAAQLTSLPLILLVSVGPLAGTLPSLPGWADDALSLTPGSAISELVRTGWYGFDGADATTSTLSFSETWASSGQPLLVLAAWTVVAVALASRSMRWEPRS